MMVFAFDVLSPDCAPPRMYCTTPQPKIKVAIANIMIIRGLSTSSVIFVINSPTVMEAAAYAATGDSRATADIARDFLCKNVCFIVGSKLRHVNNLHAMYPEVLLRKYDDPDDACEHKHPDDAPPDDPFGFFELFWASGCRDQFDDAPAEHDQREYPDKLRHKPDHINRVLQDCLDFGVRGPSNRHTRRPKYG